ASATKRGVLSQHATLASGLKRRARDYLTRRVAFGTRSFSERLRYYPYPNTFGKGARIEMSPVATSISLTKYCTLTSVRRADSKASLHSIVRPSSSISRIDATHPAS